MKHAVCDRYPAAILRFIAESNRIEGISEEDVPPESQRELYERFLSLPVLRLGDVVGFVADIQGGPLREWVGMDVTVGRHQPPRGGILIAIQLRLLLADIEMPGGHEADPFVIYRRYQVLHPFMDGNGRSGRVIWAWQMARRGYDFALGFLWKWYYQSLDAADGR